jgi:hypothetical protein
MAIVVAVWACAGPVCGALPMSPEALEAEQQYVDRLIEMADTAAAHVEMAKWCASRGMADRAKVHWREALVRDPDQAEARAALGFVRRGDTWFPASASAPEPPRPEASPEPPGPSPGQRRLQIAADLRQIARTLLVPADPARWTQGAVKVLTIRDAAGAEPVARVLGAGGPEHRRLACQALAGIPGDEATSYLLGFLLADESPEVRQAALEGLRTRLDDRVVNQLVLAVARGRQETMQRAAHALGEYGVERAVPALIANLRIVAYRTVYEKELRYPPPVTVGIPFVADVRPVVGRSVVAYDPVIGYVTPGGIRIPQYEFPQEVLVKKTERTYVEQPVVREALKAITGQDFGFDEAAWRRWHRQTGRAPSR